MYRFIASLLYIFSRVTPLSLPCPAHRDVSPHDVLVRTTGHTHAALFPPSLSVLVSACLVEERDLRGVCVCVCARASTSPTSAPLARLPFSAASTPAPSPALHALFRHKAHTSTNSRTERSTNTQLALLRSLRLPAPSSRRRDPRTCVFCEQIYPSHCHHGAHLCPAG